MSNARQDRASGRARASLRLLLAAVLFPFAPLFPAQASEGLSETDQQCLACHASPDLEKKLANGDRLTLHVKAEVFAKSVHKPIGCAGCHSDVDLKSHPGDVKNTAKTAREHSVARAGICRQCHEDAFTQHGQSVHARRIAEGNPIAPTCTGCHGSHSVTPKTAYETCVGCHSAALEAHQKWLPNSRLHHEVVSCAACHAPAALRMVDLRLYDRTQKQWVVEKADPPQFEALARTADADGKGLDAAELRQFMRELNRNGNGDALGKTLRGRVELRNNIEAHRLSGKETAIRGCENCHSNGAEPFQNVTVSITGPDGRPVRYPAQKEVLTSALSIESLPEFYAIGSTRSRLLDWLLVLVAVGSAGGALGHLTLRWLSKKYRQRTPQ